MTIVERTTLVYRHFEKLFSNKVLKAVAYSVFVAFFLFLNLSPYTHIETYAEMQAEGSWGDQQRKINIIEGVEDVDSKNTVTTVGNSFKSILHLANTELNPLVFENGEELVKSSEVSEESKVGLMQIVDSGVMAILENPPSTDVADHLAKEWIPGYDSSNTEILAVAEHKSGYQELQFSGVDVIWARVRNIAYVMFVLVMIVIGFMIMFRSKIGGQTMVTVGNAIPNIVIALVLVTFSFAIAGFIIDLGGLVMLFIVSALQGGTGVDYDKFIGISDPWEIYGVVVSGEGNMKDFLFQFEGKNLFALLWEGIATIPKLLGSAILAGIAIYGAAKLWFSLAKAYITILIQVIASPLIIATAALPGNMKAFTNWVTGVARNVLVFPCTVALINLPQALFSISNEVKLRFPGALVFENAAEYDAGSIGADSNFFIVILEIVLIFMASQVPAFLETVLPSNSSPATQKAGQKSQEALSKMPIFGSLMK